MTRKRLLPSNEVLKEMVDSGLTAMEIADAVNVERELDARSLGEPFHPVTVSAVQSALRRNKLRPRLVNRYEVELPWRVMREHTAMYAPMMLRLLGRERLRASLSDAEKVSLSYFVNAREKTSTVVAYSPTYGFVYVPAGPGDSPRGVPIRPEPLEDAEAEALLRGSAGAGPDETGPDAHGSVSDVPSPLQPDPTR